MGKTNLHPQELVSVLFIIVLMGNRKSFGRSILKVEWISDKRGTLCCIYMKFSHEKSSPSWHPYRYQVAFAKGGHQHRCPGDRQHGDEVQADLLHPQPRRSHPIQPGPHCVHWPEEVAGLWKGQNSICWRRWVRDAGIYQQMVDIGTFARFQFKAKDNSYRGSQVSAVEVLPVLAEGSKQTQVPECEASDPRETFHQLCRPSEDLLWDPGRSLGYLGHGDDRSWANKDLHPDRILSRARRQVQTLTSFFSNAITKKTG